MNTNFLDKNVTLEHLEEGQTIENLSQYVEKLKAFKTLGINGMYVTTKYYRPYSDNGLLYFKLDTLIKYFQRFNHNSLTIVCNGHALACQ